MQTLLDAIEIFGAQSLAGLWLPLALWTVAALAFFAVLRIRPLQVRYGLASALFWALPLGLLVAACTEIALPLPAEPLSAMPLDGLADPSQEIPPASPVPFTLLHSLGLLTLLVGLLAVVGCARLGGEIVRLRLFASDSTSPSAHVIREQIARWSHELGIRREPRTVFSEQAAVPFTFGWKRPVVVLPHALAENPEALRLVMLHELTHIRRHDFARHLAERIVHALLGWHPLVAHLHRLLADDRELLCDADLMARHVVNRKHYAALLLRFAETPRPLPAVALSMSDTHDHLKKRLLAMNTNTTFAPRWIILTGALLLFAAVTTFVACSDLVEPEAAVSPNQELAARASETPDDVFVVVEEMPEIVGGLAAIQSQIKYPEIARKAGIEGRVIIQFVVDEEGNVVDPQVVRGLSGGLDAEAIRALQATRFKPGRQNGETVKVKMTLPFSFALPAGE